MNTHYLWTTSMSKIAIINNLRNRCPFDVQTDSDGDIIIMNLGNNISLNFNLNWEIKTYENNVGRKMVSYRLVKIY